MSKLAPFVVLTLLFSGCATQSFNLSGTPGTIADQETSQQFFISGLGQTQITNAAEVCGGADKVAKIETKLNPLDAILGTITWGIYTPRTASVYCSK